MYRCDESQFMRLGHFPWSWLTGPAFSNIKHRGEPPSPGGGDSRTRALTRYGPIGISAAGVWGPGRLNSSADVVLTNTWDVAYHGRRIGFTKVTPLCCPVTVSFRNVPLCDRAYSHIDPIQTSGELGPLLFPLLWGPNSMPVCISAGRTKAEWEGVHRSNLTA